MKLKKVLIIEGDASNWQEAISLTADELFNNGCVKNTFKENCILREKQFPTGLPTNVAVAIPHTDAIHVIENAVCILKLKMKDLFNSMQDPNDTVNVDFVFNMSVVDDNKQLQMLQEIIKVVQDSNFLEKAKKMPLQDFKNILQKQWL